MGYERPVIVEPEQETMVPVSVRGRIPYAVPAVVGREPLAAMLGGVPQSDVPPRDTQVSDRELKADIVPVDWTRGRRPYGAPAVVRREPLAAMLAGVPPSDLPQKDAAGSDREIKADIVPVDWTRGRKP